ncbi:MAG: MerR family transcriptional regulator [Kineosporiaceae bacterium]
MAEPDADGRGPAGRTPVDGERTTADRTWTIAELADEFGVTHRTIRFYEDRGLLTPQRHGTRRIYHARERVRLALVLRGKRLGLDLAEIARIVDMYDREPGEEGQLRYLLDQIAHRRAELDQRRRDIEETLAELDAVERRCREALADAGPATSSGEVGSRSRAQPPDRRSPAPDRRVQAAAGRR